MNLQDLIDIECQLQRDETSFRDGGGARLVERDQALGLEIGRELDVDSAEARERLEGDSGFREQVAKAWLERIRPRSGPWLGKRVTAGYGIVGAALVLLGLVLGAGTATGVLAYEGKEPVNVFRFLLVFVVVQILLLAVMILLMSSRFALKKGAPCGALGRFIRWLSQARFIDRWLRSPRAEETASTFQALQTRRKLYGDLERWTLFSLSQRFGVAFNVAALVTCISLVALTDLSFGWSTTLETDAESLHQGLEILAKPWSWSGQSLVPDQDVVRDSQWLRHEGSRGFLGGNDDRAKIKEWASAWWRYLVMALACYGLIPRLMAWQFGRWKVRRAMRKSQWGHAGFMRLFERLFPPAMSWSSPNPKDVGTRAPRPGSRSPIAVAEPEAKPQAQAKRKTKAPLSFLVAWGRLGGFADPLASLARGRFQWTISGVLPAGDDLREEEATLKKLNASDVRHVLCIFEAGVQPTKEILKFLSEIRKGAGPQTQILVGIVRETEDAFGAPDEDEVVQWHKTLSTLGDPWLRLEHLVETA